jgi:zinc transporter ZupT
MIMITVMGITTMYIIQMLRIKVSCEVLILVLGDKDHESDDEDLQEEIMKNVVSSKGKFASFLQMRASVISQGSKKKDVALERASMILSKAHNKSVQEGDEQYMVNPQNVHVEDTVRVISNVQEIRKNSDNVPNTSLLTPILLLAALSFHGFFEGMALGVQGEIKDTLFLAGAILAHKWAEAFTLVRRS